MANFPEQPKTPYQFKASVWYLERLDLYHVEKPYMITFDASGFGGAKTNHKYSLHEVPMTDVRGMEDQFTLDKQGFQFLNWKTSLNLQDFSDEQKIRSQYYPEIVQQLKEVFPEAVHIHVMTHLVGELTLHLKEVQF